jgi:hypothetical protein
MKLLTKENLKALPALYSQEAKGDAAVAVVKFFNPGGAGTWYATEGSLVCPQHGAYDCQECPKDTWTDFLFFGLVDLQEKELGYFSLKELSAFRGRFGLGIERDRYFTPTTIGQLRGTK